MIRKIASRLGSRLQRGGHEGGLAVYRYVFSTGQIRQNYGGLTIAMMRRATMFAEAGAPVEITTTDWWLGYPDLRKEWLESGRLVDGVSIRNIHEEFSSLSDVNLVDAPVGQSEPHDLRVPDGYRPYLNPIDSGRRRYWYPPQERRKHEFVDYLRPNGTLYMRTRSNPGRSEWAFPPRPVGIYDTNGRFAYAFASHQDWWVFWAKMLMSESTQPLRVVQDVEALEFLDMWQRAGAASVQYVHTAHTRNYEPDGPLLPRWQKIPNGWKPFDTLAFATQAQAEEWKSRMGWENKVVVLPHAYETSCLRGLTECLRPARRDVVVVSRLAAGKGLDDVIRIFSRATYDMPDVKLHIYGEGSERRVLEASVAECGSENRVHFHGFTANAAREFAGARATVFASEHEGFGLSLLEALAHGVPAVAYDIRYGPSDMISHGVNGFLIQNRDQTAATVALRRILTEDDTFDEMSRNACERAKEFSVAASLNGWSIVFDAMEAPEVPDQVSFYLDSPKTSA